jgi:nucleoside-diphosphate-sugar epimerase
MIVAITGGTGFIGRRLVLHYLAQGSEVRVLTRRSLISTGLPDSVRIFHGGLTDSASLDPFLDGVDILFHCAGEIRDETKMKEVHVDGTARLISAASGRIKRWVQLSSVGAYGPRFLAQEITELTPLNPSGTYEISKVDSDLIVAQAEQEGLFECVILRPSNVYSVEMTNKSLFGLISMIRRGFFFYIGESGASANYIHVENVVAALVLCGEHPNAKGNVYNLSDYCTVEKIVVIVSDVFGMKLPRLRLPESVVRILVRCFVKVPGFPLTLARIDALTGRASYSIGKITSELQYRHVISMEQGMTEMARFLKLDSQLRG